MRDRLILLPGWGLGTAPLQPLAEALRGLDPRLQVQVEPLPLLVSSDPVDWLDELDANLPEDAWLGGWSLGGMLAAELAARRGERCSGLLTLARCHLPALFFNTCLFLFHQFFLGRITCNSCLGKMRRERLPVFSFPGLQESIAEAMFQREGDMLGIPDRLLLGRVQFQLVGETGCRCYRLFRRLATTADRCNK